MEGITLKGHVIQICDKNTIEKTRSISQEAIQKNISSNVDGPESGMDDPCWQNSATAAFQKRK
jgi:hypothetical protein